MTVTPCARGINLGQPRAGSLLSWRPQGGRAWKARGSSSSLVLRRILRGSGYPPEAAQVFIGNSFNVRGKGEKFRASLEVNEKGTFPVFTLSDNKERIRFMIGLEKDGEATISFFDKDGKATKVIASDSK
ncbi:hypothetical protein HY251_13300 [bacterium]|nr:hypothetical protein [bacterium]